jgi:hypothetical protein
MSDSYSRNQAFSDFMNLYFTLVLADIVVGAPLTADPSDVFSVSPVTVCELSNAKGCSSPGFFGSVTVPLASVPAGFRTN